jgi:hypothetical protein
LCGCTDGSTDEKDEEQAEFQKFPLMLRPKVGHEGVAVQGRFFTWEPGFLELPGIKLGAAASDKFAQTGNQLRKYNLHPRRGR